MKNRKTLVVSLIVVLCLVIILPCMLFGNRIKHSDPTDYTWGEYEKMSASEKAVFPDRFESMEAYNEWYESAKNENEGNLDIDVSKKDPRDYTWEDYQKLSQDEKAVFPDYFESMADYRTWYENVKKQGTETPNIDVSKKNPRDYTWEDYQKLSRDEKAVFPDYFQNMDEYYNWYNSVAPADEL